MLRLLVVFLCLIVALGESPTRATTIRASTNRTTTPAPTNGTNVTTTPSPTNGTNVTTTPAPTNGTNVTTTPAPTNGTNVTTTPAPTNGTTTMPMNITTKPVPPTKPPPYGTYSIRGKDGKYCLLAQFKAIFTIYYVKYVAEGNKTNATKETESTIVLNRSAPVIASGDCDHGRLILTWTDPEPFYTLTIEFAKSKALHASDESSFTWRLKGVSFLANLTDNPYFKNATVNMVYASHMVDNNTLINGANGSYYSCKAEEQFNLMTGKKGYKVSADFTDWKVEPFVEKSSEDDFGSGKECYQDTPTTASTPKSKDNDIVPIAVGCALAGLVLIVLIAYVIGRRKSHRGYEKV